MSHITKKPLSQFLQEMSVHGDAGFYIAGIQKMLEAETDLNRIIFKLNSIKKETLLEINLLSESEDKIMLDKFDNILYLIEVGIKNTTEQLLIVNFKGNPSNRQINLDFEFQSYKCDLAEERDPVTKEAIETEPSLVGIEYQRIMLDIDKLTIHNFFSILEKVKNPMNGMSIFSPEEKNSFLSKNFVCFDQPVDDRFVKINLAWHQKGILMNFIYKFYSLYDNSRGSKRKYARLLIESFDLFKNDSVKNILSNMNSSKAPKGSIDIEQFLSQSA